MDSCYSGGVSERKARDVKIADPYQKLAEGEGRIVIAASQPNQRSFEDSKIGHGVFTYNLLEALSGKADLDNDGYVTVLDAYKYIQDTVPRDAMKLAGGKQEDKDYGSLNPLVAGNNHTIKMNYIVDNWDRMAQFYASLEGGHVTASTALKRIVGFTSKNHFYQANLQLGRILKTEHILCWMADPHKRRRTRKGLLKGLKIPIEN